MTIVECPGCKFDFDADRGPACPHCDRPLAPETCARCKCELEPGYYWLDGADSKNRYCELCGVKYGMKQTRAC